MTSRRWSLALLEKVRNWTAERKSKDPLSNNQSQKPANMAAKEFLLAFAQPTRTSYTQWASSQQKNKLQGRRFNCYPLPDLPCLSQGLQLSHCNRCGESVTRTIQPMHGCRSCPPTASWGTEALGSCSSQEGGFSTQGWCCNPRAGPGKAEGGGEIVRKGRARAS